MQLYHHKTDGGAEYLMDNFIEWEHAGKSGKEGVINGSKYIVRIDGDITKDAELMIRDEFPKYFISEKYGSVYWQEDGIVHFAPLSTDNTFSTNEGGIVEVWDEISPEDKENIINSTK